MVRQSGCRFRHPHHFDPNLCCPNDYPVGFTNNGYIDLSVFMGFVSPLEGLGVPSFSRKPRPQDEYATYHGAVTRVGVYLNPMAGCAMRRGQPKRLLLMDDLLSVPLAGRCSWLPRSSGASQQSRLACR